MLYYYYDYPLPPTTSANSNDPGDRVIGYYHNLIKTKPPETEAFFVIYGTAGDLVAPHKLRHTFVTMLYGGGGHKLLGHENIVEDVMAIFGVLLRNTILKKKGFSIAGYSAVW